MYVWTYFHELLHLLPIFLEKYKQMRSGLRLWYGTVLSFRSISLIGRLITIFHKVTANEILY